MDDHTFRSTWIDLTSRVLYWTAFNQLSMWEAKHQAALMWETLIT